MKNIFPRPYFHHTVCHSNIFKIFKCVSSFFYNNHLKLYRYLPILSFFKNSLKISISIHILYLLRQKIMINQNNQTSNETNVPFHRRSVSWDGAQHPLPSDVLLGGESGQVRRAPRVAGYGQRADWPSRAHRRPRFRAFHREVPAGRRSQVLQIRNGLPRNAKQWIVK